MEPGEALAWVLGDAAPSPIFDPRDYYFTIPPSQRTRRSRILRDLEAAGLVSFPDAQTVVFESGGIRRTTKLEED